MNTNGHDVIRVYAFLPQKGQFHPIYSTVDSGRIFFNVVYV